MGSRRGPCPIEDWIGRRYRDCGTSIIAYLRRLGTKWERRLAFASPWRIENGGKVLGRGPEYNFRFERCGRIYQVLEWTRRTGG